MFDKCGELSFKLIKNDVEKFVFTKYRVHICIEYDVPFFFYFVHIYIVPI